MRPIRSMTASGASGVRIVRSDGAVFEKTRDDVKAMLAQPGMTRPKVRDAIRVELGTFLEIDPAKLTNKVLMDVALNGGVALTLLHDED